MPLEHWLQLALTQGIGPILIRRLVDAAGSAAAACQANSTFLKQIEGIGPAKAGSIAESLKQAKGQVQKELDQAAAAGIRLLCPEDSAYSPMLREISDPPAVLYVKGNLEDRDLNGLAIVGSRKCSYYGREQADRFAALLAGAGFTVISGGARGVDSAAHRGALSHPQGRTIAVLGCGIDQVYPPENAGLFDQIARRGAIISEYPLGTPPLADNFPRRNRLVSGLSRGVLVVEADERSGALITARLACDDHGRPVFALPGRIDNALSAGPHKLIRQGAVLTTRLEDILEELGPVPQSAGQVAGEESLFAAESSPRPEMENKAAPSMTNLNDSQQRILADMSVDSISVDSLVQSTGLPASAILQELTFLSLKGLVRRIEGQSYALRKQ